MMDLAELRRLVERHFRVYDARSEKVRGEVAAHRLFLMFPAGEFDARFEAAKAAILAREPESIVFVRREQGEDVLWVAARPPAEPVRHGVHLLLLVLTIATTTISGAYAWSSFANPGAGLRWQAGFEPVNLLWGGLTFALPLLAILGIHEGAHFVAARRHRLRATPPFFIPAPPLLMPVGTFGAFIRMRDPLPDRKALFDVGASGPLAGFLVAIPILVAGAFLTMQAAHVVPDLGAPRLDADLPYELVDAEAGTATMRFRDVAPGFVVVQFAAPETMHPWPYSVETRATAANGTVAGGSFQASLDERNETVRHFLAVPEGASQVDVVLTWEDGFIRFGDPLLLVLLNEAIPTQDYFSHPLFFAGWVGLLVTGINLLPVGQLDGGHVARAVFGDKARHVATAAAGLLVLLAFQFASWMLMALFVFLMGIHHPPPLNDRTRLDRKRVVLAVAVLAVFALCFVPVPIHG